MTLQPYLRKFFWLLPVALLMGAALASIQPGAWWIGWIGVSALSLLGLILLVVARRRSGSGRSMAWMIGLTLVLRLAAGVAVYIALPINGHNVPDDKTGYVFTDAHRRDGQAWDLAQSGKPLWAAFDKTYYTDQYGGLLAISALTYKVFSPDTHRPLLIVLLASLVAALGIPFLFQAARLLWNERLASAAAWFSVVYPESVLTGGAQMREPFLLTLIAMALWGFARWVQEREQRALLWIGAAMVGMLLVSPAMALATLVLLAGWSWARGEHKRLPWPVIAATGGIALLGILFLAWSLSRQHDFSAGSPIGVILNWARHSVAFVVYQLEQGSGQIQNVFSKLNPLAQFVFVVGYGVLQPVLPPAFFAPTTLTWHAIAVFRAVGWYLTLPLLFYAPIAAWRSKPGTDRRTWIWLTIFSWAWIVVCAIRAGGDQWDNPRYRLIFFDVQALAAGFAWVWWREQKDSWLPRIVALEVLCVLLFSQWYLARYYRVGIHLPIMVVLALGVGFTALILLGGWIWDSIQARRRQAGQGTGYNSAV